jgi:hypothetical protein
MTFSCSDGAVRQAQVGLLVVKVKVMIMVVHVELRLPPVVRGMLLGMQAQVGLKLSLLKMKF